MGLTGQNAFYTACAYLHGPVFVFGGVISVSLRWTAGSGRTLSVSLRSPASSPFCRLPATSSPGRGKSFEGRALGKEGRSRPHQSPAGRSQPISGKLYALAKASPFRERWHGEAVTERVASRTNPLSRLRRQLPREGEPLAKRGSFVLTGQRQEEACC